MKIFFDSNIFDLLEDDELRGLYDQARELKLIDHIITHINLDQLNPISDFNKRSSVLAVAGVLNTASTFGYVDGISRQGWTSPAPVETLVEFIGNQSMSHGNVQDTLLASTARHEGAILITNDKDLRKKCIRFDIKTMNDHEFKLFLRDLVKVN